MREKYGQRTLKDEATYEMQALFLLLLLSLEGDKTVSMVLWH
jgi:hypothetical protein